MIYILIRALLVIGGVVYMAGETVFRGKLSDPAHNPNDTAERTLEPRHKGVGFLGLEPNWPGVVMIVAGALLLLSPIFS